MTEYRRKLPHFHPDGAYLFVTWRLWGTLPRRSHMAGETACPTTKRFQTAGETATAGQAFVADDRELDRATKGPTWLSNPRIASMVADTIRAGDDERHFYKLRAWVILSNHVHLLILPHVAVPAITRWLKGSTARRANQILGRARTPFWQDESFDHWVRNDHQFERIVRYIEENPVKAGLVKSAWDWPWSSANGQAKPPAPQISSGARPAT
jgi:REP element-mobilizing transposase RayT